ncbi:alpha/beta hydrolase [Streptomyces sp. NPDC020742]|uniref:alpha/beta fold hydrolase n=1 Tax=unclassified Streptomyces TaxID=2593676 RepID=UPI0033E7C086
MSELRKVQVGDVQLAYREWGEPTAPPAVLLHCLGEDGEDWRGVVGRLAGTHRVLALDQRGHGHSDRPGEYGFARWRDDVLGFLQALGLERVTLIGHALGATAAVLVAAERPGLVDRLILEEAAPPLPAEPQEGPQPFDPDATPAAAGHHTPDPRWWDALPRITAPTLVIAGGPTSPVPQEQLAALAERIPDARMVTVEGAGHLVHEERPGEFLAAVTSFLAPRS